MPPGSTSPYTHRPIRAGRPGSGAQGIGEQRPAEHRELTAMYGARGLDPAVAAQVAEQLMTYDALGAHARDVFEAPSITRPCPRSFTDEPPAWGYVGANTARLPARRWPTAWRQACCSRCASQRTSRNPLRAVTTVEVVRNAENRLRIGRIGVDHHLGAASAEMKSPGSGGRPVREGLHRDPKRSLGGRGRSMFHRR